MIKTSYIYVKVYEKRGILKCTAFTVEGGKMRIPFLMVVFGVSLCPAPLYFVKESDRLV